MNTVKHKMKNIMKKMISVVITLAMLVQYLPVNWLQDVFADEGSKPISVSFLQSGPTGTTLRPAGNGNYLMSIGTPMTIDVRLRPNWNQNEGSAKTPKLKLDLPWFYYKDGIVVSTTNPQQVKTENPDVQFIGGIEAKLASAPTTWYSIKPSIDSEYGWGSDYSIDSETEKVKGDFRRTSLDITSTSNINQTTTFSITFQFFTLNDAKIPENTSAPVAVGASYAQFVDSNGKESDGYSISPGGAIKAGEDATDVRTINIVNSNLEWETSVKPVSTPILWDKYNYGVYEVDIKNISEDEESAIDYFNFILNVPSSVFNGNQNGVLDQDLMAWRYNEKTKDFDKNEDIGTDAKEGEYGGKYQEGGALIWDVTNESDLSSFDIDEYASQHPSQYRYKYSQSGELGVVIGSNKNTEGTLKKDQYRKFYVAIPYVNNFQSGFQPSIKLTQTIYFGGRDLAWSKNDEKNFNFEKQKTDFTHQKYLIDNSNNHLTEKAVPIGKEFSYYLDGFANISNTPVFNSYAVDTLPEEFNLSSLAIEMDDGEVLSNWFKNDDPTSFISFKFKDKDNNENWVSLKDLGIVSTVDGNTWKLENIRDALKKYLKNNEGVEFTRDVRFEFKERIAVNEALKGRIVVSGSGKYLIDYKNNLNTYFQQWNWSPYSNIGSADGEDEPHYVKTNKHIATEATAVAKSERAQPQTTGYGVVHDPDDRTKDLINTNTNDKGEACQQVSLADKNAAVRFSLGNISESEMIPAEFTVSNLLQEKSKGVYAGLEASSVYLSSELVSNSKIDSIDFTDMNGTVYNVKFSSLDGYKGSDGSILIPKKCWKDNISNLKDVKINFEEFLGNIINDKEKVYIEVNGTPNSTGEYRIGGTFTTNYNSYEGLSGVQEDVANTTAILVVKRIEPTIEASANYKGNQSTNVSNPLTVPNKSSKVDPTNPTYYQFKIGNDSESSAQNVNLVFDLLSVGNASKDNANPKLKGFDTEKFVIKKGYDKAMDIEKIEFFDYDQDPDNDNAKWVIKAADLTTYINSDGDIVIDQSKFPSDMKRVKVVKVIVSTFNKLIQNDDRSVVEIYGNTDSYSKYNKNNRLEANLLFKPIGPLYNDEDTREKSAAFNVNAGKLTVDNDVYQKNVTSEIVGKSSNTDGNEKTLGIPYSRDFTYRVSLWNKEESVLDDVKTKIEIPSYDKDNGGFHTTSVVIYEDLLKQYQSFNNKNTFKSVVFNYKTALSTLIKQEIEMTYDADNHQLIYGDKKYTAENGKFKLSIDDVAKGNQLESITLTGKNFVINKDADVKPYIEINGWSDAEITSSNILTTTATHYLDGMEEDANKDYRITSNDTANAYQSKLYYDTTIVAAYNDNAQNTTNRFTNVSTPKEHVRNHYVLGQDNSELEIGYKGLGSYAVDFRQYLYSGANLPSNEYIYSQENSSFIKTTSYNTAANVKMEVNLPSDKFDAYYLRIDKRVKNYIKQIVVTRQDGKKYTLTKADVENRFDATTGNYGRINLLQSGNTFSDQNMFSTDEDDYYKAPKSYKVNNPIISATIELKINQKATKEENGETVANEPDYGTWWNETDESTKYMFEFAGRFYQEGVANASVSSTVTIGGEDNEGHTSSIERSTQGTANNPRGKSWSYRNYYRCSTSYNTYYPEYKSDHLYSVGSAMVVRDYDRITKGATINATNDYNRDAKIADDNQYYINFFRNTRCDVYGTFNYNDYYETGYSGSWYRQDPDDWNGKVGYADHVDIVDTLGMIVPDETYDYNGTLTTALQFHKQIANYFKDNDTAVELTLGTGTTQAEQNANKITYELKKSDLKQSGDYYVIKFNNDNDKLSDSDAESKTLTLKDGVLYLEKNQYVLSFKAKMYDIQGNGEYNSEMKDKYYNYTDADGNKVNGVDNFSNANDIIVNVKPYMVYENNSTKIQQATNTVTTRTYHDYEDTAYANIMNNNSSRRTDDSAYIMGYRIPFKAGYQIDHLGRTPIDSKDDVTGDGEQNITDYLTTDGTSYDMLNGKKHKITQNKTPTNVQFGVKAFNQTVEDPADRTTPARIRELTTTDTMNPNYRMRNIYLPVQWVDNGGAAGASGTDNGQWFKVSQLQVNINGNIVTFKPTADGKALETDMIGLTNNKIELKTTKEVNGQKCYVLNIEDFARSNESYLVHKTTSGLAQVIVNNFKFTFTAAHPDFKNDKTVMSNGEYLTASKANDAYSYFYDGTYVDRTVEDFEKDEWTYDSVPTFGKTTENYFSPAGTNTSNRDVYNTLSMSFKSIDNNADTFHLVDTKNNDYYHLRNSVAILTPSLTKERTISGSATSVFAYDNDSNNENDRTNPLEVDKDHLMPYDYVEYILSSGNHENAEIPLERNHLKFTVAKGQQIIGWELVDAGGIKNGKTNKLITAEDIKATLVGDTSTDTVNDVKEKKDYSVKDDNSDSCYRTIEFIVGDEGTEVAAGQTVKIRIITQLTDEAYESYVVKSNAYAWADTKHQYRQYAIDGYNSTDYVTGSTNNGDSYYYKRNGANDQSVEGVISYYRYHSNENYLARMASQVQFYDNKALKITYDFDSNEYMFDSQGAYLTVSNIQNDTMHFIDEQTVTVNFLDKDKYQGFILDKIPTVSKTQSEGGDIYYPDAFVAQVGSNYKDILVEYTTDDPTDENAKWVKATYKENNTTIHAIKGIRWTYFNVPAGYPKTDSVYKDEITFDDVVLDGEARYEDIRTNNTAKRADTYKSVDTATISHKKEHSEEKKVIRADGTEEKITVEREVTLNEDAEVKKDVYRESPQVILHPQVFDDENEASVKEAYDQNNTHDDQQKVGYRPNDTYWQKISLVNRKMVTNDNQTARQGRLIAPIIYDKLPKDYVSVKDGTLGFKWTDINGNEKTGDYKIVSKDVKNVKQKDYGGNMIYKKSGLNRTAKSVNSYPGMKAFDDLDTSDSYTLETDYTLKTYQIVDENNKPITMEIGDTLTVYYQLKVAKDNLPMVYVDEDKDVETKDDQHPAYFPRVGEYYQYTENYGGYDGHGMSYPFSTNYTNDGTHYRAVQNSDRQMDMDYLLHDVGVSATTNNYTDDAGVKHNNIDNWEFLQQSIVYIPGDGNNTSYNNTRFGGGNGVLADYDISSLNYVQQTTYTPVQDTNNLDEGALPDYKQTSLIGNNDKKRDWYEQVVKKRTIVNDSYNSGTIADNWNSATPIIWGQNRIHLQKAWLVSASEFMDATLNDDGTLTDNDPTKEHRTYKTTKGDGLTDNVSNPNYNISDGRWSGPSYNQVHSFVDDNYEVGLEYNEEFTTKLQALNYGDWSLSHGVEFTYTMPRGIEPLIFDDDGNVDLNKFKAEILESVNGVSSDQQTVNETYQLLSSGVLKVEVLQKPETNGTYHYQAPTTWQDAQNTTTKDDYQAGDDTAPWVLKITVDTSLSKWFNRGSESGYKLNVYFPSKVVRTNENEEWFDRLQTKPYVPDDNYEDYYYYQILDIDHFEGTTKENMQNNQRYGMDYMWFRGDGNGASYYYSNGTFYYYNGSPNTPYVDGYNIQNKEVTISEDNGIYKATATNNNANYGKADSIDRYSQTGTRAVMRKPLLRQWTTVGDDQTGNTLSDYYLDTEGTTSKLNIHVENKYYWDILGTNCQWYDSGSYADGSKSVHSYATDGGGRGTYKLPVITNILPYGIAPVGVKDGKSDIYSTKNNENADRVLNWDLLDASGQALTDNEKETYDVKVTYEQIARKDEDDNVVKDDNGKTVTEGRYVVRFYPKEGADTKINSGDGRTFTFDTFVYASPKVDTFNGDNKDLQDTYESNYTYLSSEIDGFKALIDEDITGNPYTVGSLAYNRYRRDNNTYLIVDTRFDAIQNVISWVKYGNLPDSTIEDKVTGKTHYVVGQGMNRVKENDDTYPFVFNIEDYTKQSIDGIETIIRNNLILDEKLRDFNLNGKNEHNDYKGSESLGDIAFVNTTKIRTRQPNLTLENYVSSSSDEEGKKTPVKDNQGNEVKSGSVKYTDKKFDYGDDVWYSAKLTNKADSTDYAHQGSVAHSRFVFSFHLPKAVSVTDLPDFNTASDHWDQFRDDDFVIEIEHANGNKTSVTPSQLKDSGFGIRIINKQYTPTSPTKNHTNQIVTYEVTTPQTDGFSDYSSFVNGEKPAGYLASGDTLTLKIRTRVDNKEEDGIDPSDKNGVDVWTGYYSEVYSTLHTTNGEYIVTNTGNIYDDNERNKISSDETIIYDGYQFNKDTNRDYDKSFTKQLNMTWLDKEVSDSDDKTEDDGTVTKGNDYDQDGDLNEDFAYSSSASISILKPKATTRVDTSKLRKQVNDLDAEVAVIDDAHVRSADIMEMRLTEAVNNQAKLNQFITSMSIPYHGTNRATSKPASVSDTEMDTDIQGIRTGSWEIPDSIDNYQIYKDHLKVYLYAYMVDDPWSMSGVISPSQDPDHWVLIGNQNGYNLTDNTLLTKDEITQDKGNKYIYQLNWVVKMEGFTDDDGNTYSESNAAINYPVPVGLRLNTTGKDNKGVDENDPQRQNITEDIMHDEGVVDNCAYISVVTGPKDISDGVAKHVNYFATTYGRYDDYKYSAISTSCRAGFYIDPELPTLQIGMEQAYYKASMEESSSGDGNMVSHYRWDYSGTTIDDTASKMLKYRVSMMNKKKNDTDITVEDNATNPNITIALPYNENLDTNQLKYMPYGEASESNYINDNYNSINESLDSKTPLWTWYIVNEDDGSIATPSDIKPVEVTDDTPLVKSKPLTASRKEKSKILNFYFTGQLKPGQTLRVELMVPVRRMNSNAISAELLRCKGYIFKNGAFSTYMPDQGNSNASAYEYDSQDVNENNRYNDTALTKMTTAIGFTTTQALGQSKLVDTELETNVTAVPAAVNEGGDYTFKVSSASLSNEPAYQYTNNVIYDVLPYSGDHYAYQINSKNERMNRNSKWNGWLNTDSINVIENISGEDTKVDSSQYDVWVGPIIKEGNKYVLNTDDNGNPVLPDENDLHNAQTILSITNNDANKQQYFVKLSDLKTYLKSVDEDEQEKLVKGIRAIWLQMRPEYTIQPGCRLEMSYTMHAPQNVKKYVGNVKVDETQDTSSQITEAVKNFTGWNTFLSRAYSLANTEIGFENIEETSAGVYIDAPSDRGYIGSYVWQDVNYNGKIDEGTYEDTHGIGRNLLVKGTEKYDLNGDGKKDDPGVNGVKVELLTEHGRPANKEGEAIRVDDEGRYILVNDETGKDLLADEGTSQERPRYSTSGPATYTTESDYYGNKGYFVFSNLKPGKYNLRYTLPKEYKDYSITTKDINTVNDKTPVIIYRDGKAVYGNSDTAKAQQAAYEVKKGTLVAQTAQSIQVDAVDEGEDTHQAYDEKAMGYNLGVGRTNLYKGTTWLDETEDGNGGYIIEGQMDYPQAEERLGDIKVEAYEVNPATSQPLSDEPAIDADGNKASYVTKASAIGDLKAGEYQFRLVPGKTYIIKATNKNTTPLKATAPIYSQDPTKDTGYNDLLLQGGKLITNQFNVPYIVGDKIADWENYPDEHTIDLGFVNAARGFIGELVWDDKDYDGIQDPDEDPLENVTVTLEQYYYKDSKWQKSPNTSDIQTNAAGAYKFTVSTYYEDGDNRYLAGYKVRIDRDKNKDLFKKYAPTFKDKETNGKQSDLDETSKDDNSYYLTDDVVVIASEVGDTTQEDNSVECGGTHYDLGNAETKNFDAGFKDYESGKIDGIVWLDANYDGIRDANEKIADKDNLTDNEKLLAKIKAQIKGYYYDNGKWNEANDATVQWSANDVELKLADDGYYHYTFKDLPTEVQDGNGKTYLMGYKVTLDETSIDKTLKPTLSYQTDSDKDSDLVKRSGNYALMKKDDYVITAKKLSDTDEKHKGTLEKVDGNTYDLLQHQNTDHYDAGLTGIETSAISGQVWIDDNYDGIQNDDENPLKDVEVKLVRYIVTKDNDGKFVYTKDTSYSEPTVKTGAKGRYKFEQLEDSPNDGERLYAYQVVIDPSQTAIDGAATRLGITKYHQGTSDTKDSDWSNDGTLLDNSGDYLILLNKANDSTPDANNVLGYDIVKGKAYNDVNAGATPYQNGKISGNIFDDKDYNGLNTKNDDKGLDGVEVVLKQYYIDENNEYVEIPEGSKTTTTNSSGDYSFDNLPTNGYINSNGTNKRVIYRYTVSVKNLPNDYVVTKYHKGKDDERDSNIDPQDSQYTLKDKSGNPYIILAKESDNDKLAQYLDGYDLIVNKDKAKYDGGLTKFHNGTISGTIFDDKDYNGLLDENEGQKGITVVLVQYEKDGNDYIPTGMIDSVETDENGKYTFENVPTYGENDAENRKVLYAYRVTLDESTLPEGYGITKYRVNDKDESSKLSSDYELISNKENQFKDSQEPYIIMAEKTDDSSIPYNIDGYDIVGNNSIKHLNGGIKEFEKGSITGTIFDDKDYNGLLGKDDKGYQGINVILTQYQKVGDEYFPTGMIDSVETDENGKYTFSEIPTYGTNEEGERVLYAYRVTLDEDSLPEGYGVTRYRVNDKDESSKLSSNGYELISDKDNQFKDSKEPFIIMAKKTDDDSIPYGVEGYDVIENNSIKALNGGISKIQTGSISGKIFNDDDYDGLSNKDDQGFEGIEISLKQYYLKDNEYIETEKTFTCKTTSDGSYKFDQLPTNGIENDEHVIYYYKAFVDLDTLPSGYAITKYHVGKDDTKDSDLLSKSGELLGKDQYMVLVDKADKDNVQSIVNGYDIITAKDIKFLDGGLTSYNLGSIEGTLWIDANRNGIIDQNESRLSHRKMVLKGYYYKDNQWIEESSLDSEVETDENGKYIFSHLPASITKDEQTYLVGYQVFIAELPKDKEITEYLKNNGKNDSKLKKGDLRLIPIQYDKDGYLIVADRFDEDNINNQSYNYEGYNIIKAIDIKDMNAGFYDPDKPVMTGNSSPIVQLLQRIKTGDNVSIMGYVLLGLISCGIIVLIVFKKRKDNE